METPKLSPAKINPTKLLPGTSISTKKISTKSLQNESISVLKSDLFIIKKQVFKVRDLIQTSTLIKQSELEKKRKSAERKKTEKQEEKLEAKPEKEEGKLKMPSVPKLGFLDRIKNFLFSILLGYISIKLLPHLPKLVGVVSTIGNVMEFMLDLGGNILDKVVTFIDWGYKAIDATRGFIKSVGGEFSLQIFDNFTGAVSGIITATITAALALSAMSGGDGGGSPGGGKPRVGGKGAGRVDPKVARRYAERFGKDAALKKFGKEGVGKLGGKYARSGVTNLARKGLVGLAGKGGAKMILGFARPLLKRLPIIGALIDFGLSVALGEDLGRAAFKAIGAGLLGSIGAALGSIVPLAGTFLGGLAGGLLGDMAGGALYDAFFGGKKPQQKNQKVEKKAGGGITRGNKLTGGKIGRTIKKPKRTIRTSPSKVNPGQSIGGEKKIKNIFPEVKSVDKGIKINTYGYMKSSYEKLSSAEAFGGLFALPLKAQLGQEPSKLDYQNAASGLNSWMQRTFSSEIMRTGGVGFAEGGKVEAGMFSNGEDMTKVIEKSLEDSISSKVTASINDLKKQLGLKPDEKDGKKGDEKSDETGMSGTGDYSPEGLQGEIYKYLISKGMDDIHAIGLMANISRESEFRPGISEDGGPGVGLFQYSSEPRKSNFLKAVPDYKNNWKGQIDYALKEPGEPAPQWLAMKFSSSQEAADWFMRKWERPREDIQSTLGPKKHKEYIASLEKYKSKTGKGYNLPSADLGETSATLKGKFGLLSTNGSVADKSMSPSSTFSDTVLHHNKSDSDPYNQGPGRIFKTPRDYVMTRGPQSMDRGTPVPAGVGGKVTHASGYTVVVADNAGKDRMQFHHFDKISARVGQSVSPNTILGTQGNAGTRAVHVHLDASAADHGRWIQGITKSFSKGGRISKPTRALIGERGAEFIFDADTTRGLDRLAPLLLEKLNAAKTKPQLASILQSYAPYESGAEQTVVISREMIPIPILMGNSGSGGMIPSSSSSSVNTTYDRQFANA